MAPLMQEYREKYPSIPLYLRGDSGFDFSAVSSRKKWSTQTVCRYMCWHTTYSIGSAVWCFQPEWKTAGRYHPFETAEGRCKSDSFSRIYNIQALQRLSLQGRVLWNSYEHQESEGYSIAGIAADNRRLCRQIWTLISKAIVCRWQRDQCVHFWFRLPSVQKSEVNFKGFTHGVGKKHASWIIQVNNTFCATFNFIFCTSSGHFPSKNLGVSFLRVAMPGAMHEHLANARQRAAMLRVWLWSKIRIG